MMISVSIEEQERAAREAGFDIWSPYCHVCNEQVAEGDDCSQEHYTKWLLEMLPSLSCESI